MFNRSWYKNTWLGKKLGFKIDWNKEVLVHKSSSKTTVRMFHTKEDEMYIGFKSWVASSINPDSTVHERVETEMVYTWADYLNLDEYIIMYDKSKIEALSKIQEIEQSNIRIGTNTDDNAYVIVKSGMGEKEAHEYKLSVMFLMEASKYIVGVEVVHLVRKGWGVRLICAGRDASKLRVLVSKYITSSKTKHILC